IDVWRKALDAAKIPWRSTIKEPKRFRNSQAHSELLILLAFADWAHDDGYCWPTISALATKARLSERAVQQIPWKADSDRTHSNSTDSGRRTRACESIPG